jgi:CYTH domain-containing protein
MGYKVEIERKFLVNIEKLPQLPKGRRLTQGYLSFGPKATVRVRTEEAEDSREDIACLTIKGSGLVGRDEFEYKIPSDEANQLLKLAQATLVTKRRIILPVEGLPELKWELDIFDGENEGLVVAEIELPHEDFDFPHPDWLGQDVTEDPSYKNAALAQTPYKKWQV